MILGYNKTWKTLFWTAFGTFWKGGLCRPILLLRIYLEIHSPRYLHPKNRRGSPNPPVASWKTGYSCFLFFTGQVMWNGVLEAAEVEEGEQKIPATPSQWGCEQEENLANPWGLRNIWRPLSEQEAIKGKLGKNRVEIFFFYFCVLFWVSLVIFHLFNKFPTLLLSLFFFLLKVTVVMIISYIHMMLYTLWYILDITVFYKRQVWGCFANDKCSIHFLPFLIGLSLKVFLVFHSFWQILDGFGVFVCTQDNLLSYCQSELNEESEEKYYH